MKKTLITSVIGTLFAGSAYAQSSVTLYGIVDVGITYTSNVGGSHQVALTSGGETGSRWGLTGVEDLGNRLKTIFTLENGFSATTGALKQGGSLFGRQAFVGISSDQYGTVTFGRQNDASYSTMTGYLRLSAGGTWASSGTADGTHAVDVDNLDGINIISNAVKYQSPNFGGLIFSGMYSLGGVAGNFTRNNIYDVAVGYDNGLLKMGASYFFAKDPNFSFWGGKPSDSLTGSNIPYVTVAGYASAESEQIAVVGGGYTLGPAIVSLLYSNVKFGGLGSITGVTTGAAAQYRGSASFNTGEINVTYQVNPALLLGAAYSQTRDSGANNSEGAKYQQMNLGAIYSVSKRTSLYATAAYQKASGTNSLGKSAVADLTSGTAPSGNDHELSVIMGIRHKF
ncbi:hypothetical protein EOS_17045 [Caballeronia mineralivorans PML1(12)]|uniref:Porin domain-containing protein n=1 Tax=Caballeronia mineralivorans PML1(12) TaxID=908627 RepID=A0A0J1CWP0_9BURK|nr:porin [Caballeronia mineralivorans]KLU24995.1 hypothetical protein EOS_17045 [Caballeronia mineralivorans PML1(12)]